jgi:hypothetical protein
LEGKGREAAEVLSQPGGHRRRTEGVQRGKGSSQRQQKTIEKVFEDGRPSGARWSDMWSRASGRERQAPDTRRQTYHVTGLRHAPTV